MAQKSGSRSVFLRKLHELEKREKRQRKGDYVPSSPYLSRSFRENITDQDKSAIASGGYPNLGYDDENDDNIEDDYEIIEDDEIGLDIDDDNDDDYDDDEGTTARRKAEEWLRSCENADDISKVSSVRTSITAPRRRPHELEQNGKSYLKTEPGLVRKLYPVQPHGARKTSWLNIFERLESKKLSYRLKKMFNNKDAELARNEQKAHHHHHHHHSEDPYRKRRPLKRRKTKKLKNMTKYERRIHFKHLGKTKNLSSFLDQCTQYI